MQVRMRMYGVIQTTDSPSKAWGFRLTNSSPSPPAFRLLAHANVMFKRCCSAEGDEGVGVLGGGRVARGVGGVLLRVHGAGARGVMNFGS
jgi:hypothetical protein